MAAPVDAAIFYRIRSQSEGAQRACALPRRSRGKLSGCRILGRGACRVLLVGCVAMVFVSPSSLVAASGHQRVIGRVIAASATPLLAVDPCIDVRALVRGEASFDGSYSPPSSCLASSYEPPVVGAPCSSSSVHAGATIEVRNGRDALLAATTLTPGGLVANGDCAFSFSVAVPAAARYNFVVDDLHRVTYTARQLRGARYVVGVSA